MKYTSALFMLFAIPFSTHAQNMGIKLAAATSPNTTLDVNGSTAFREGTALTLVNGVNPDITLADYSLFRITGPTAAFSIIGFIGGQNGRVLTLINATSQILTFSHQASSTSSYQINTGGSSLNLATNGVATLIYNSTLSKWVVSGGIGFTTNWSLTGNSNTTAGTNFIGTADAQDLVFKANNTEGVRLLTSGNVGIGSSAPAYKLHVEEPGGYNGDIGVRLYNTNVSAYQPSLLLQSSRGTKALPTAITSSTLLGVIRWGGYDGSAFNDIDCAEIGATATENWSTTAHGSKLTFNTIPNTTITTATRMTIDQNGYVGIGTTTPNRKLTISRNASTTDAEDDMQIQSYGTYRAPAFLMTSARGTETSPTNLANGDTLGGFYFKGYANSAERSLGAITNVYTGDGTTTKSMMAFNTSGSGTANERMRIDENGYVGIGTTTPTAALHVSSNLAGLYNDMLLSGYNDADIPVFNIRRARGTETAPTNLSNGDGLGGHHYYGYVNSGWSYLSGVQGMYKGNGTTSLSSLILRTSNADQLTIDESGNVGIGCASPQYKLHVIGNVGVTGTIRASGTITASTSITACSDFRFKTNIHPLSNALENVLKMQGVTYDWRIKEFPEWHFNDRKQIGVIAQDLEKIYPELVDTDEKGFKSVDYSKMTPILVEAIKNQQTIIETQKIEIDDLKKQANATQQELDNLKKLMAQFTAQLEALAKKQN